MVHLLYASKFTPLDLLYASLFRCAEKVSFRGIDGVSKSEHHLSARFERVSFRGKGYCTLLFFEESE